MKFFQKYYHILTSIFVFIIYLITLAPTVVKIDSGELTTVQTTLGIAHPTGYPLFTIIGYLFTLIPLPFTDVYKLNLLCAIWCASSVGVFVYTVKYVLDNIQYFIPKKIPVRGKQTKKIKKQVYQSSNTISLSENIKLIAAIFSGLLLAFSKTFWEQSTSVEVYSLHIFLIAHIIFFLVKAYTDSSDRLLPKNWILFVIFLALGFTNHMTTILILPGVAYLFFNKFGFNKKSLSKILISLVIFFFIIIIFYSYLPIRASQNPILNWGNPIDFERIMRHISGKQYQVWLFSSTAAAKKQFTYFINSLPSQFSLSLLISLLGLVYSFIYAKKFGIFILITFVTTVLYSINYDINDIDSYFLLAYISIAFFSVFGIIKLISLLRLKKFSHSISIGVITLFILLQAYSNYGKVNNGNNYTYEDYTKTILASVTKNAVVFTYQWDYFVSPSYYFQYVNGYRKDVTVIDKELMRRSWYYNQLKHLHPDEIKGVQTEINMFLNAVKPFENGENYDSNLLESIYRRLMTNLVKTNVDKRDFYVAPELFENEMRRGEFTLPEGYTLVPDLFLFKVVKGNNYVPASDPDFTIRFPAILDKYLNNIEKFFICPMLIRRALYELKYDKTERARIYIEKVKRDFPDYRIPLELEQVIK